MMELKAGYKQTEVGVIPEDWEVKRFGEIAMPRRQRIDPRKSGVQEFCVELEHIGSATGSLLGSTSTGEQSSLKSVFRASDVLFGKLRAYLRKYWRADCPGVCSTEIWVLLPIENLIISAYLFQIVQTDKFIEAASSSYGTHMPRSDWNVVKNYALPLPPTKAEQEAIAEALSDTDALIGSLEQLIAKKRQIKQGAMQELLTGKKRLPGFSREWEVKQLADIAPLQRGFDLPNPQLKPGPYPVVYSNGVLNYHATFQVRGPGVVTGRSGTIGKVSFVEQDFWPHNTSLWITSFKGNDPKFVFFLFTRIRLERFATGSGVPTLNRNDVHDFKVSIPSSIEEQTAIATILSDMDAEIAAQETQLAKTRSLKQSMMQELLTGKTRLI